MSASFEPALAAAHAAAQALNSTPSDDAATTGPWRVTLDGPSYMPFMKYAKNRAHRKTLWQSFGSRGFLNNDQNNEDIIKRIVRLRKERALLLGYKSHAHFVLEERMAKSPQAVRQFLEEFGEKAGPAAQIKWIDEISKTGREKQKQFLQYFTHLLELAVRISTTNEQPQANAETDFALRLNKITQLHQQEAIINELNKASYYIERNANAKMLFHALSIKLYHIINNNSLILVN